jgi:hypothetical protein
MNRVFVAAAAALSVAAVAGSTVVLSAGAASAASAGARFTADRAALATADKAFSTSFVAWETSGKPASDTTSFVNTYVAAIESDDHNLLNQSWPAGAVADIDAVVRGDGAVVGVVDTLPSMSPSSTLTQWFLAYNADAASTVASANVVRHDLGLPLQSFS